MKTYCKDMCFCVFYDFQSIGSAVVHQTDRAANRLEIIEKARKACLDHAYSLKCKENLRTNL